LGVTSKNPQEAHYVEIHDAYASHYYDAPSLRYRERFLFSPLLKHLNLNGSRIADVACGSGYNSLLLRSHFPSARFEGFDISPVACADYRRLLDSPAHHVDLTLPLSIQGEQFDAAIVIGGLHHCVQNLAAAFDNLGRIVRPGGHLLLWEANAGFLLQAIRDSWYRKDRLFEEETERALTVEEVEAAADPYFTNTRLRYFGGPAYFFILNSLVTRIPLSVKPMIERPLFVVEAAWNTLKNPALFPTFSGIWQRRF
jgi:SAM-dependent methyltransferase